VQTLRTHTKKKKKEVIIVGLAQPLRISLVHPFANFLEKKKIESFTIEISKFQ